METFNFLKGNLNGINLILCKNNQEKEMLSNFLINKFSTKNHYFLYGKNKLKSKHFNNSLIFTNYQKNKTFLKENNFHLLNTSQSMVFMFKNTLKVENYFQKFKSEKKFKNIIVSNSVNNWILKNRRNYEFTLDLSDDKENYDNKEKYDLLEYNYDNPIRIETFPEQDETYLDF